MTFMDRVKMRWIWWALKKTKGNKMQAARLLGISIVGLRAWVRKHGPVRPRSRRD